jgi:DNA-binding NarL/FixJ family response regulator
MEGKPNILVIDNETAFRASLAEALLSKGFRITSVGCCDEARDSMSAERPDLVILGTVSPCGEAYKLHCWMRGAASYKTIPTIVIDAPLEKQSVSGWRRFEGMRLEAEDYLVKPVDPYALVPRVTKLLDKVTRKVRVLVVDDHALIRDSITALLSLQKDMQVVGVAENGREALLKLAESHPDVVVMDLRMPEMNGLEATREICRTPHHAKVLVLSQYDDQENLVACKQAGAWDFVPKQSASNRLVSAIRAAGWAA